MLSEKEYLDVIERTTLTAVDLIFLYNNKILLGYRNNHPAKGFWFTPGGRTGKMEKNEDALIRVALNECGINLSKEDYQLLGVYDHIYENNFSNQDFGTHYVVSAFLIELKNFPDLKHDSQHSEFIWEDINNVESNPNIHPNVKRYIPDIKQKIETKKKILLLDKIKNYVPSEILSYYSDN
jgi:colanic acid biosynthesis protein WcaH